MISDIALFLFQSIVFPGVFFIVTLAFGSNWMYRKIYARLQRRVGPDSAGKYGFMQGFADFLKTASKEEIVPRSANQVIFRVLPIIAPVPIIVGIFFIPMMGLRGMISSPGDIYAIVFILTIVTAIEIVLGWSSGSKYSLIGASRSGMQLVSFGIPLIFSMLYPIIRAGSFNLMDIVLAQDGTNFGFLPRWNVLGLGVIAFVLFLISALAELEKPPFDTPEAETEIAGGWTLEYSGRSYAYILLMEDLKMVFVISIGVVLFLGGPLGPTFGISGWGLALLYFVYFSLKYFMVLIILTIISSGLARLKIRQIVFGSWSFLTPISIVFIILVMVLGGV